MISAFLNVLERISFDETLFRKEFAKTLLWVSYDDYPIIEQWMHNNQISEKFPDLEKLFEIFRHKSEFLLTENS